MADISRNLFGYDDLATLFSTYPEIFIVRSFPWLRARRILQLQGRLVNHEQEVRYLITRNRRSTDPKVQNFHRSMRDWRGPHQGKEAIERLEKEKMISSDLSEYGN